MLGAAYLGYANAKQRASLAEEFYGPHFALFKADGKRSLKDLLEQHPEKKPYVLKHLKEALTPMMEKGLVSHEIVHHALHEYLQLAGEKERTEMMDMILKLVVEMVHTRDGSEVGLLALKYATTKDRKVLLKSMKSYVLNICNNEHGFMVILAALDIVDDTVLLNKMILSEIGAHVAELAADPHGLKVGAVFVSFAASSPPA